MSKLSLRASCQLALLLLLVLAALTPGALDAHVLAPASAPHQAHIQSDSQSKNTPTNPPGLIGPMGVQGVVTLDVSVPDTIRAGDNIDYTYTYVNTGATTATGLAVEAIWTNFALTVNGNWQFCNPANTCDVLAGSVLGPAVTKSTGPTVTTPRFTIGDLAPGQQGRFTVRLGTRRDIYPKTNQPVSRPAGSGNLYLNGATNTPTSQDTAATLVIGPVLVLTKTATTTGKIYPTETGTFNVRIGNASGTGDSTNGQLRADARPATNLIIKDTIPQGGEFVSATGNPTVDTVAKTVTWTIAGPLIPGQTINLQVVFKKLDVNIDCGSLNNGALTVTSDEIPLNGNVRYLINGTGASILLQIPMVIKSIVATPGSVVYGANGTIAIIVQNFWNQPLTGVKLNYFVQSNGSYMPGSASPAPTTAPDGSQPGGTVTWTFNMPAGSKTTPTEATFSLGVVGGYDSVVQAGTGRAQVVAPAGVPSACIQPRDGRLGLNPRLKLTKTTDADPATKAGNTYSVERGQEFNYIIDVTNTGVAPATAVNITDLLPKETGANFRYVGGSATVPPTTVTDGLGGVIAWNGLSIPAGGTLQIRYRLIVDGRDFQSYCNTASATSGNEAITYGARNVCVKINPQILITKTVDKATANPGDTVRFTLTLANQENVPYQVGLYDRLGDFIFVNQESGTAGQPQLLGPQKALSWPLMTLQPGQQVQAVIVAQIPTTCVTRDYINEVLFSIVDGLIQSIPPVTAKVRVNCGQIEYSKTSDRPIVSLQDRIVYTLPIRNAGGTLVSNVEVDDLLPQGFTFVGMEGTSAILTPPTKQITTDGRTKLIWTLPSIAPNTTVNIKFIARSGDVVGDYDNLVTVPVGGKCVGACKSGSDGILYSFRTVTVQPLITMEPKITPNICALPGDKRTYQLSIVNTNNHDYGSTEVLLTLPFGLRYNKVLNSTPAPSSVTTANNGVSTIKWSNLRIPAKPANAFGSQVVLEIELQAGQVWGNLDTVVATTSPDGLIPRKDGVVNPTVQVCPTSPALTKDVNRTIVSAGNDVVYRIMLANPTDTPFTATIEDQLPNNFSFVANVQGQASVSGNTLTWANVAVPAATNGVAGVVILEFSAHINSTEKGARYTNTATVTSSSVPLDTTYNSITVRVTLTSFLPLIRR
jgi:uncharacterized repeat protein (TIGR01451 family)/fimbrial isopeptide formation D2 family protein